MPLRRILPLVFAAAAAVAVLTVLVDLRGRLPAAAGVIALLAVALAVVLFVRRPVARWALAAGIVVMAAVAVVGRSSTGPLESLSPVDVARFFRQSAEGEYASAVLLAIAAAALTVGVAALPQDRRPVWPAVVACLVTLVPVIVVATQVADERDLLPPSVSPLVLFWHFAPGLLATVLAGLAVVLAVTRADRWFLLPAGALLVQVTAAYATWCLSGSWYPASSARGVEGGSAFLELGMRTQVSTIAVVPFHFEIGAALATAALLLGPALIAAGAARTAPAPDRPQEA